MSGRIVGHFLLPAYSLSGLMLLTREPKEAEQLLGEVGQGKKAMARKDLERILAEDSSYEGVREQLAELSA